MPIALLKGVKLPGHSLAATSAAGLSQSRLLYVTDCSTGLQFLVDTGADVSVVPPTRTERAHRQDLHLSAVNNTSIVTYGTRSLTLNLGLRRKFQWPFIMQKPIIGADFLHHFSLMVDVKHRCLLDGLTQLSVQGISTVDPHLSLKMPAPNPGNAFAAIIREFLEVTQAYVTERSVKHNVTHHIRTTGPPVTSCTR